MSHSAFNNFTLKSVIPQKHRPVHRYFLCQVEFLSSFTHLRTFSLVTLSTQLIFSNLFLVCTSEASNLLSVQVSIAVSAAYSATLQTKHFIILFLCYRFILPVDNFFLHKHFDHHYNSAPSIFGTISVRMIHYCIAFFFGICNGAPSCLIQIIMAEFKVLNCLGVATGICIFRSTSKSRPNNIRGEKCPSVRPQKVFFDLNEIWYVGRGRWVMHDGMPYGRI